MDKKTWTEYMLSIRDPPQNKRPTQIEIEGMENNIPSKQTWKKIKDGVVILISDKIDLRTKAIKRDKGGHYIILKGTNHQEDITLINIYAPNIVASKYIRKILEDLKKDLNSKYS